jgi:hypothetical protein
MTNSTNIDMEAVVHEQYRLWNGEKREELLSYMKSLGPNGFTVEFVGGPVQDGVEAIESTWDKYGSKTKLEIVLLHTENGVITIPSIDFYKVEDGKLTIRYYHHEPS